MANMNEDLNNIDVPMETNENPSKPVTIVGFETKQDILDEINYRLNLLNKFTICIKKLPKSLTKGTLIDLFPEMVSCRFPENYERKKYAFIKFSNESNVEKYIEMLENKKFNGKKLIASKVASSKVYTDIDSFDLKTLYFNGLKSHTKFFEIKNLYPKTKIVFPTNSDKTSKGSVILKFETEEEALVAFAENKMNLHGIKCQLIFQLKKHQKNESIQKFSFDNPDELLQEIISRYHAQNERSIMLKNLPSSFSLSDLRQLVVSMRNCKLTNKRIWSINFDDSDLAKKSIKELNEKIIENHKIQAFPVKKNVSFSNLSLFTMTKLHLSNLSIDTTEADIMSRFSDCEIELPMNPDNTCIGYAVLTFGSSEDALKYFCRHTVLIRNVRVQINFHSETKGTVATEKLQSSKSMDENLISKKRRKKSNKNKKSPIEQSEESKNVNPVLSNKKQKKKKRKNSSGKTTEKSINSSSDIIGSKHQIEIKKAEDKGDERQIIKVNKKNFLKSSGIIQKSSSISQPAKRKMTDENSKKSSKKARNK